MKLALLLLAANLFAQTQSEKLTIAFSDPARAGTVKMNILHGSIAVKAHAGKDVQVESISTSEKETEREVPESARGLKRLNTIGSSITLEEENNVVTISLGWKSRSENYTIYVPAKTSLKLSVVNGKMLTVDGVDGDMELNSTNGGIQLNDVSGSVVAHALNGKLLAKFKSVDPTKPMSFSSMNGTIDVTLPASIKANLKMQNSMGDIFTDFDVKMQPTSTTIEKSEPRSTPRSSSRVRMNTSSLGTINGGGPDYSFKNFNGKIYIRKSN